MENEPPDPVAALIGARQVRRYLVTERDIRRFSQAIAATDPVHFDESHARKTRHLGIVAPPLFCQSLAYEEVPPDELGPDGSPKEIDVPIPARRTVGGSSDYRIFRLVRPGDVISATTFVRDVTVKQGRSGTLYLVSVETRFTDAADQPVATEIATYIKRV